MDQHMQQTRVDPRKQALLEARFVAGPKVRNLSMLTRCAVIAVHLPRRRDRSRYAHPGSAVHFVALSFSFIS